MGAFDGTAEFYTDDDLDHLEWGGAILRRGGLRRDSQVGGGGRQGTIIKLEGLPTSFSLLSRMLRVQKSSLVTSPA